MYNFVDGHSSSFQYLAIMSLALMNVSVWYSSPHVHQLFECQYLGMQQLQMYQINLDNFSQFLSLCKTSNLKTPSRYLFANTTESRNKCEFPAVPPLSVIRTSNGGTNADPTVYFTALVPCVDFPSLHLLNVLVSFCIWGQSLDLNSPHLLPNPIMWDLWRSL